MEIKPPGQVIREEIRETETSLLHKCLDVSRFLLTVSITLMTLLLPLAIYAAGKRPSLYLLGGAVVALIGACVLSLLNSVWEIQAIRDKVDNLKAAKAYLSGEGKRPALYISPLKKIERRAIGGAVCFGLAVVLLCGALFQILFS